MIVIRVLFALIRNILADRAELVTENELPPTARGACRSMLPAVGDGV